MPRVSLSTAEQCVSYLAVVTHTRVRSLSLHVFTPRCYGECLFFPSYLSISCYPPKMTSKLTLVFSLRYVVFLRLRLRLRLRLILRSALHLCRLSPFPVLVLHPPRAYSKMLSAAYPGIQQMVLYLCSSCPPFFAMSCPFANSLNCAVVACDAFISLSMLFYYQTACGTIFRSLARSTHAPSSGTQTASRAALRSSHSRIQPQSTQS